MGKTPGTYLSSPDFLPLPPAQFRACAAPRVTIATGNLKPSSTPHQNDSAFPGKVLKQASAHYGPRARSGLQPGSVCPGAENSFHSFKRL